MPPRKKKGKSHGSHNTDQLITKRFADSEINKWKKMDKSTEEFLIEVLDEGISTISTNSKKDQYSEINTHLKESRHRLVKKWRELKMPKNSFGTYKGLRKLNASYTSILSEMAEHAEELERAVHKAEKSCKAMEEELEKRDMCLEEGITDLHPLMKAPVETSLKIPPIPRFEADF